jgi:hypothetical protein
VDHRKHLDASLADLVEHPIAVQEAFALSVIRRVAADALGNRNDVVERFLRPDYRCSHRPNR